MYISEFTDIDLHIHTGIWTDIIKSHRILLLLGPASTYFQAAFCSRFCDKNKKDFHLHFEDEDVARFCCRFIHAHYHHEWLSASNPCVTLHLCDFFGMSRDLFQEWPWTVDTINQAFEHDHLRPYIRPRDVLDVVGDPFFDTKLTPEAIVMVANCHNLSNIEARVLVYMDDTGMDLVDRIQWRPRRVSAEYFAIVVCTIFADKPTIRDAYTVIAVSPFPREVFLNNRALWNGIPLVNSETGPVVAIKNLDMSIQQLWKRMTMGLFLQIEKDHFVFTL